MLYRLYHVDYVLLLVTYMTSQFSFNNIRYLERCQVPRILPIAQMGGSCDQSGSWPGWKIHCHFKMIDNEINKITITGSSYLLYVKMFREWVIFLSNATNLATKCHVFLNILGFGLQVPKIDLTRHNISQQLSFVVI